MPLVNQNMESFFEKGACDALTGPVERNDAETVNAHISVLTGNQKEVYKDLSKDLLCIAKQKHKEIDFTDIESILE